MKQLKLVSLSFLITIICIFDPHLVYPLNEFSEASIIGDLKGNWIHKGYLDEITINKSPIKTIRKYEYSALMINKENETVVGILILNFHEGLNFNLTNIEPIKKTNKYKALLSEKGQMAKYETSIVLEKQIGNEIAQVSISNYRTKIVRQEFLKASPSIDSLINRRVLKGKYIDQDGHLFEFTNELIAIWPQNKFKYTICTSIMHEQDCFYEADRKTRKTYIYEFKKDTLIIKDTDNKTILFKLKKLHN